METVRQWLEQLGLSQYVEIFERNAVDLDLLRVLTDEDLEKVGIHPLGHRKKLLRAISELNSTVGSAPKAQGVQDREPTGESPGTTAERRQVTVLFCDLVGSTELSTKLDPEELRDLMHMYQRACGEAIVRYEGHVAQYLGDGLMSYFGWPIAHEDDAVRAIHAGLEITEAVSKLTASTPISARVGIHTGLVVVGETGQGDASIPKAAVGETPNIAARLQALAEPGGVVVSEWTRSLARGLFDYADLGAQPLKGVVKPVRLYRVSGTRAIESRFEASHGEIALTPMVGRQEEIALLLRRWKQGKEGEGQVVLLGGEPGIGKSRILRALRGRLKPQGAGILTFQCSPYYVNSAFFPFIDNFERALKFGRDESSESKLDKLEALIVTHYGRPREDVRFIAAMLSIPCEERYGTLTMTPQKHKDETLRTLVDLTEAAACKQPTVMLFEDAHWADPTTLEVLDLLIDRMRKFPLLVVLTHRPEFRSRWSAHGHVTALNLSKLTRAQVGEIVSRIAQGKSLPSELHEHIIVKTDGVPLFVEELTKSILESGILKDAGDRYGYSGSPASVTVPATLRDSLMARLDRFMPVKEIGQVGAVIGHEFSYELIAAVAPHTRAELDSALIQLTESGLAFRRGTVPDAVYTFKHALVQDAAYDSLLKSRRQALHAKIARVLEELFPNSKDTEPELLAHHLTAAGETERAIGYWQKAGKLALKRLALKEAVTHLNKGMELIGTLPMSRQRDASELGLRALLGTAWLALKGWAAPEVWSSFRPALELAKSLSRHEALVPIYYGLYTNVVAQGRAAESLAWVNEALASAEASGDPHLLIFGHRTACNIYFYLGEFNQSREHGHRVLAQYNEEKHRHLADITNVDPKTTAGVFVSLDTWMLGYPDRAVRVNESSIAHARRRGHPFDLGFALSIGGQVWDLRFEPELLLIRAEEAERVGRAHSLPFISEVMAQMYKGIGWLRAGRLAEGIPTLRTAMERLNAHGALVWMPYLRAVLAEGLALSGDIESGLSLIEESLTQIARPGWEERSHLAEILRLKGWMLSLKGDLEAAERCYLASLEWARKQQAKSWELRTSASLARLWQSQGKHKAAYELLAPIYGWFTEGFDTHDLKEAKALLHELA